MSTVVIVNTYTHSVTFVTNKLLSSLKDIINLSGLSLERFMDDWAVLERGVRTWLDTQHLTQLVLEVFDPKTTKLVGRWDLAIEYGYRGDSSFWINAEDLRYHIKKAGVLPSECNYRVVATTKQGRPDVQGWSPTILRPTDGFVKQSIGTTIDGSGLTVGTGYWRKG